MARVLIVDDEEDLLELLAYNLEVSGFEVDRARSGRRALDAVRRQRPRIETDPAQPRWIETVRGTGYRFAPV